jgi:polyisoprenoid-binding protein YceI
MIASTFRMCRRGKDFVSVPLPAFLLLAAAAVAKPGEVVLQFAPARTSVNFTLGDVLHTVHGTFDLKRGTVQFSPTTNAISGEIVIDTASGHSGSDGRDGKMHREILESSRFPETVFRPDRVDGKVAAQGASTIQVHGLFSLHGADHQITIPVQVQMAADHWEATAHFSIPYVEWGLKNPSTFLLRVSKTVDIDVKASGPFPAAAVP